MSLNTCVLIGLPFFFFFLNVFAFASKLKLTPVETKRKLGQSTPGLLSCQDLKRDCLKGAYIHPHKNTLIFAGQWGPVFATSSSEVFVHSLG